MGRTGSRARPGRGECGHATCVVSRAPGGQLFFGRCLVCGRTGPGRPTSKAARDALVAEPKRDPGG